MAQNVLINELGYYPDQKKIAVCGGDKLPHFLVCEASDKGVVYSNSPSGAIINESTGETCYSPDST